MRYTMELTENGKTVRGAVIVSLSEGIKRVRAIIGAETIYNSGAFYGAVTDETIITYVKEAKICLEKNLKKIANGETLTIQGKLENLGFKYEEEDLKFLNL